MTRQRLRIVSEQRIARVGAELSKRCPLFGVKLSTDGSATVLTAEGSVYLTPSHYADKPPGRQ